MTNLKSLRIIKNRYILQQIICPGGMTTIYRGRDIISDNPIAIKRFDRDINLPKLEREAFEREVEALKNLNHPNIVRIIDSGEDDEGKLFLILELMDHDLLQEKERSGKAFDGWDDFTEIIMRWAPSLGQDRDYTKSGFRYPQGVFIEPINYTMS